MKLKYVYSNHRLYDEAGGRRSDTSYLEIEDYDWIRSEERKHGDWYLCSLDGEIICVSKTRVGGWRRTHPPSTTAAIYAEDELHVLRIMYEHVRTKGRRLVASKEEGEWERAR